MILYNFLTGIISSLTTFTLVSCSHRPEGAAEVRYAEGSMKDGFGLMHLHKFLSIPFLQLQVRGREGRGRGREEGRKEGGREREREREEERGREGDVILACTHAARDPPAPVEGEQRTDVSSQRGTEHCSTD